MPVVIVNKTRLFYRLEGSDGLPVLALSHSIGTDHGMWEPQVHALLPYFRILRYDTRGHGGSETPGGEYTVEELGRDFLGILDARKDLPLPHFAACRWAVQLANGSALHAPERLNGLVLANTGPRIGTCDSWNCANQCRTARWDGGDCRSGRCSASFRRLHRPRNRMWVGSVGLSGNSSGRLPGMLRRVTRL